MTPGATLAAGAPVSPRIVFAVASGAVFMVSLDATIAVAAFPALREAFASASPTLLSWVLNAYTIVYAALLAPAGRLADLMGRRRLFVLGVALFTAASVVCGLVADPFALIAARAAQAAGGALLTPASLALILAAFAPEKRAAAVGLWSAVGALAAAIGPAAGAAVIEATSWRAVFLLNLPVGLAIAALALRLPPDLKGPASGARLDLRGVALLIAGVGSLTLGVVEVEDWGPTSPGVLGAVAVGLLLLALYRIYARGRTDAAVDLALFADRTYALVSVATVLFGVAFSLMFLSSYLFLITIWGFGQGHAGLALTPGPLVVIPVAIVSGRLAGRVGHRPLLMAGGLLYAAAQLTLFAFASNDPAYWTLWFPMQIVGGSAVGLLLASLAGAAVSTLPPTRFGVGGAVNNALRQLGGVFGAAIAVVLIGAATADLARFRSGFLVIAALGLAVSILASALKRPETPGAAVAERAEPRAPSRCRPASSEGVAPGG